VLTRHVLFSIVIVCLGGRRSTPVVQPNLRPRTEGLVFIKRLELIGALSLLFRYGENSGDSMHVEAHFRTSCHYQMFF